MSIFEKPELTLTSNAKNFITKSIIPLFSGDTVGYNYWEPGAFPLETSPPSGTWDGAITDEDTGAFEYVIAVDVLTIGTWKTKPFVVKGGKKTYGQSDTFIVESENA